ncbi:glycosyltransferase family 39 protein [bacterium]|nr:glycosyltransferase family 39 protein [bacterium]
MDIEKNRILTWIIVTILLTLFLLQGVCAIVNTGLTSDEYMHIAAGATYVKTHDFRMNTEHPPLTKSLAGAAVVLAGAEVPVDTPGWESKDEVEYAREFWDANRSNMRKLTTAARIPLLVFATMMGVFIFLFARVIYNVKAGLLSLLIFAFEPNLIAHAALVNSDVAIAMVVVAALYFAFMFLQTLKSGHFIGLLIFSALAIVTKFSGLFLLPLILLIYWYFLRNYPTQFHLPAHILGMKLPTRAGFGRSLILVLIIAFWFAVAGSLAILASYSFKLTVISPENSPNFVALAEETIPDALPGKDAIIGFAQKMPLSKEYIMGVYQVMMHNRAGHPAYLLGNFSTKGWWYYFPVVFFYKIPIAILALLVLNLLFTFRKDREIWINEAVLIIPTVAYIIPAFASHINIGVRHLFFVFPLLIIYASGVMTVTFRKRKRFDADEYKVGGKPKKTRMNSKSLVFQAVIGGLCVFLVLSNLSQAPNHLSYMNEFAGDAQNRAYLMSDSNIDWGQGLPALTRWAKRQNIQRIHLYYHMVDDPATYEFDYIMEDPAALDPEMFMPGEVYAVSLWTAAGYGLTYDLFNDPEAVQEHEDAYLAFIGNKPDAVVGGSFWVFAP